MFIDWNKIDDPSIFAEFGKCQKLNCLLLRGNAIDNATFEILMNNLKENKVQLDVLDLYSNALTNKSALFLSEFITEYKNISSFSFGNNKITNINSFDGFFAQCGKLEVT